MIIICILVICLAIWLLWKLLCALWAGFLAILPALGILILVVLGVAAVAGIVWLFLPYKGNDVMPRKRRSHESPELPQETQTPTLEYEDRGMPSGMAQELSQRIGNLIINIGGGDQPLRKYATIEAEGEKVRVNIYNKLSAKSCHRIREKIENESISCVAYGDYLLEVAT